MAKEMTDMLARQLSHPRNNSGIYLPLNFMLLSFIFLLKPLCQVLLLAAESILKCYNYKSSINNSVIDSNNLMQSWSAFVEINKSKWQILIC